MATNDATETSRTLKRLYRNRDGEITKRLSESVEAVIIETIHGGHRVEAELSLLFPTMPEPCMGLAAAAFGLNTVLGNEIAGKDKSDPAALAQLMQERFEAITEGEWSEGRQGPRIKDVLNAWASDAKERGKPVTDASIEKMRQRLLSGEVSTKDLLNQSTVNAWYQKLKAEAAVAKFNAAKAAAEGAGTASKFDDIFNS